MKWTNKEIARGWSCRKTPIEDCFWIKIKKGKKSSDCWKWLASESQTGYGAIGYRGMMHLAHRISWMIYTKRSIPKGKFVLHKCDNRKCTNPRHLYLGTYKDNNRDCWERGRASAPPVMRGSKNPRSKLTESDVLKIRSERLKQVPIMILAKEFGVSDGTIQDVCSRQWRHI